MAGSRGVQDLQDLDAVFGALAHQSRRTILLVLQIRGGSMTSRDIADRFDCSWPTTSRHLRVLQEAGLITVRLRGRERVYDVNPARLHAVTGSWLSRFTAPPRPEETASAESPGST